MNIFKDKVSVVLQQLDLPISVYAATDKDIYRKPRIGMWEEMLEDYDVDVTESIDLKASVFVGDAGGRSESEGFPADHSSCDRYIRRIQGALQNHR